MMTRKQMWRTTCAFATTIGMLQPTMLMAATPELVTGPPSSAVVSKMIVPAASEPTLTVAQKVALLREKVKYVFVLFQENRSFDQHFGTFPGANGLVPAPNVSGLHAADRQHRRHRRHHFGRS